MLLETSLGAKKMNLTKQESLLLLSIIRNASYLPAYLSSQGDFHDHLDSIHEKLTKELKQNKIL